MLDALPPPPPPSAPPPRFRAALAVVEGLTAMAFTVIVAALALQAYAPWSFDVLRAAEKAAQGAGATAGSEAAALAWILGVQNLFLVLFGVGLARLRCPPRDPPAVSPARRVLWGMGTGILALAAAAAVALVQNVVGVPVHEQEPLIEILQRVPPAWAFSWIAVLAPLGEEVFFRGYLFRFLRSRGSRTLAHVATAGAFALIHANPSGTLVYAGIGLVLAWAYERTRSLTVPVLAHAVHNALTLAALYAAPPA